jgi:hypothetical protein
MSCIQGSHKHCCKLCFTINSYSSYQDCTSTWFICFSVWIFYFLTPLPPVLVVTVLSHRCIPLQTWERRRSRAMRPLKHEPAKPHCFLTHCCLNPKATSMEEAPSSWRSAVSLQTPCPPQGVARAQWDKEIPAGHTLPYAGRRWANCALPHGSPGRLDL